MCINAFDVDGQPVDVVDAINGPQNGVLSGINDGDTCLTYTPDLDWNGLDSVQVIVCDSMLGCDTAWVYIEVTPVNDDPVILDGGTPADTVCVHSQREARGRRCSAPRLREG